LVTSIQKSENSSPVNYRKKKTFNKRSELEGPDPISPRILIGGCVALAMVLIGSMVGIGITTSRLAEAAGQADLSSISAIRNCLIGLGSISLVLIPGLFLFNRISQQRQNAENALSELEKSYGEQLASLAFAQAETDRIMETVQEGLFLIDREGIIGNYHSREAPIILRQQELAGASLHEILKLHLSEKMYKTSRDFFDLLFDAKRKERTVLSVNPLTDVEVNFPNPEGGFITRYLGFSFRRIMVDGKVDRLFVALRDVTKQVELETQLREAEKTKEREMQVLLSVVHVPHHELDAFVKLATQELETINSTLRAEDFAVSRGRNDVLRERLQTVYRSVHNLNGNAALLKLTYFQKSAFEFETKIKDLLSRKTLTGDDFLSIVIAQAGLRGNLTDLQNLRSQLGNNLNVAASAPQHEAPTSVLAEQLRQLVQTAAADLEKSADLTVDEFALHAFSHGRTDLIRDVLVQLIRNAVAHGVEPAEIRKAAGKPDTAKLSIHALPAPAPGVHGLAVRDDGRGLDLERIRERAEKAGLLQPSESTSTEQIIQCIFESGFSTAEEADRHSGRGVGMDIVKSKFVESAGGCIEVLSEPGQFCEFRLYMPS
jgi:two-component system, chemotaxis family, sensor kinase CheA